MNNLGKTEKNKNVKEGDCVFPFQYKKQKHSSCVSTEKGPICATTVSERGTLKTYGYCTPVSITKKLIKKTPSSSKTRKMSPVTRSQNSLSKQKVLETSDNKLQTMNGVDSAVGSVVEKENATNIVSKKRLNEDFARAFAELNDIYMRKGEPFRGRAYKKAEETILLQNENITDYSQMKGMPNIGEAILGKLKELQETGTLRLLERERKDPLQIFTQIHGIGPKKAQLLIEKGITTIDELRHEVTLHNDLLNDNQKNGLKYFDDISQRIPRDIIDQYKTIFQSTVESLNDEGISIDIVGSYRRNTPSSGDIDVVLTHKENKSSIFTEFLDRLSSQGIILEFLTKGKVKSLTITKMNDDIARRVDFLYAPPDEYSFAKLYFTGSKGFNTVMRHRALQFGYTLNEHGFSKMEGKIKGNKMTLIEFPDEKSIFDFLKMEFKEPHERKDGRAVVSSNGSPIIMKKVVKVGKKAVNPTNQGEKKLAKSKKNATAAMEDVNTESNAESNTESSAKSYAESSAKSSAKPSTKPISQTSEKMSTRSRKTTPDSNTQDISIPELSRNIIDNFRSEGLKYLDSISESELNEFMKDANNAFFNDVSFVTDNEYDIIKEYMQRVYPKNEVIKNIGAPVVDRNKVSLPYYMGSMDKIKPDTNAIVKWKEKYAGPYVISAKLDGVSGLYSTENGTAKLYTRGDGKVGQDISYFIPYLQLPKDENISIRGEFIINRHIFEEKYKDQFSNPRNFVSGLINSKTIDSDKFGDIHFVAYEVIQPILSPHDQMRALEKMNVQNVLYEVKSDVSNEMLSDVLVNWRNNYHYESDGIIVSNDRIYDRVEKNPDHSFAFKMVLSEQIAEAKVLDILWNVSKNGLIKPKVQIEPVVLGGATIQYATGHNAATVVNNKLGVGAIVKIIRSGDVIPYIMETVVPAQVIKMPDMEYKWNKTKIDIELVDKSSNKEMNHKNITGFFTGIGVEGLSSGNITRIINAGYNSVADILNMSESDFMNVEGFKEKMATKIHHSIRDKIQSAELVTIISASNVFGQGFGTRKIKLILDGQSDILQSDASVQDKVDLLLQIKGMAEKTARGFVQKIPDMIKFLEQTKLLYKLQKDAIPVVTYDTEHELYGKSIVFTGVREKQLMEKLESAYNVKLSSSVSKNTFAVIAKSKDEESGKLTKARSLNIPIYELNEFKEKYHM